LLGDLLTVKAYDLPVKIIVFNNSTLGMVKLEMLVEGLPDFATDQADVDFAGIAAGMGLRSVRVENARDLENVLASECTREGPAVIGSVTDPNALSLPPKVTPEQVKGVATAMTKEVLGGGVADVMSMARSNLRNIPRKFGLK